MGRLMSYSNTDHSPMTEVHEERIQRLEGSMEKVLIGTTATAVKMDHLVETVEKGFKAVNSRLDEGATRFDEHKAEIAALKGKEEVRGKRWAMVKGSVFPLFAAGAGVIATKFGERIWTWLSLF